MLKRFEPEITVDKDGNTSEYIIKEYTETHREYKERTSVVKPIIVRDKSIPNITRATDHTHYTEFKHPNMMSTISAEMLFHPEGSVYIPDNAGCAYYFRQFDETILRPLLIYKYKKMKHKP